MAVRFKGGQGDGKGARGGLRLGTAEGRGGEGTGGEGWGGERSRGEGRPQQRRLRVRQGGGGTECVVGVAGSRVREVTHQRVALCLVLQHLSPISWPVPSSSWANS